MALWLSTFLVYILSFLVAYLALKWYQGHNGMKHDGKYKLPPCLPYLPIVGSLFFIPDLKRFYVYFMERSRSNGNIIAFYLGNRYAVVLNGRNVIHEALVKHPLNFASRPSFYFSKMFNPKLTGIVEHPYDDHFKIHQRLSLNILKQFGFGQGIMESRIKMEVEDLVQRIKSKNGQPFDPNFELTAAVSNVICSIIFGKRWSLDDPNFQEGIEIIHLMVRDVSEPFMINFFPIVRFLPTMKKVVQKAKVLNNRWKTYIKNVLKKVAENKETENFYSLYLEELKTLKHHENRAECDIDDEDQLENTIRDLFLAGTETTATTLQWLICLIANHPDIQKQVWDELDRVVGPKRLPCLEDKPNLPLTEATILELMRYKTLVPVALPHLTLRETVINGILIPNDVMVVPNLYSAHMNPDDWSEPEKFKIERFLNESRTQVIKRDHVISFSLGKRACLGELLARQELFLFASALLHQFEIFPPEGQKEIFAEEKIGVTVSPLPFEARFVKRY